MCSLMSSPETNYHFVSLFVNCHACTVENCLKIGTCKPSQRRRNRQRSRSRAWLPPRSACAKKPARSWLSEHLRSDHVRGDHGSAVPVRSVGTRSTFCRSGRRRFEKKKKASMSAWPWGRGLAVLRTKKEKNVISWQTCNLDDAERITVRCLRKTFKEEANKMSLAIPNALCNGLYQEGSPPFVPFCRRNRYVLSETTPILYVLSVKNVRVLLLRMSVIGEKYAITECTC